MNERIAIVATSWYKEEMLDRMVSLAEETVKKENGVLIKTVRVPGSFDIPIVVKKLLEQKDVDGVVTLGALIQGETHHDVAIMNAVAPALTQLSLQYNKPVVLGINGPRMTLSQGMKRAERAGEVTKACIELVRTMRML